VYRPIVLASPSHQGACRRKNEGHLLLTGHAGANMRVGPEMAGQPLGRGGTTRPPKDATRRLSKAVRAGSHTLKVRGAGCRLGSSWVRQEAKASCQRERADTCNSSSSSSSRKCGWSVAVDKINTQNTEQNVGSQRSEESQEITRGEEREGA
jgi:hypothetical protein